MPKVTLRPTIAADLPHVTGEPLPYRIRAITALIDDRVIGLGGIAFPPQGPAIAFVQFTPSSPNADSTVCHNDPTAKSIPEARRYPVAFHRAGLMAMEMIRKSEVRQVVATADADSDVAVQWLNMCISLSIGVSRTSTFTGRMHISDRACPGLFFHVYGTAVGHACFFSLERVARWRGRSRMRTCNLAMHGSG